MARAVGDHNVVDYPIPRKNCELGFIILLQRVEGLYKDVPDVLELLSSFIGRAIVDEVLAPSFLDHVETLQTDMGYAVINHVKHLLAGPQHKVDDLLLNVWGTNSSKSIASMKSAIKLIISEYLISRELDEALTAIQELNIPMFHHEIVKQLIPSVTDYYVAKDLLVESSNAQTMSAAEMERLNIPKELYGKAMQIELAIDLISTALEHNIMAIEQIRAGFKRLRERMDDYKLDCPLIDKYYDCIAAQFAKVLDSDTKQSEIEQKDEKTESMSQQKKVGGARGRQIDEEIKEIIAQSKDLVIAYAQKENVEFKAKKFEGIECRTQTVAGVNYFIKICVNDGEYIHVFLWKKLDGGMQVLKVEFDCKVSDTLAFGQPQQEQKQKKTAKRMMCGGLRERDLDEFVIETCARIREDVVSKAKSEGKYSTEFTEFTPVSAKSQVVAGTNLFVKVRVSSNAFIHIRVWCKLDSCLELSNVEWEKTESDEIVYF